MRRVLYLHGFASGPGSRKGRAFDAYLGERGFGVERLDLRLPDRNALRVSAMIAHTSKQLDGDPTILIGSSLGGLVASHVAAARTDITHCVLMAPAFRFAERWRESLGAARVAAWQAGEPLIVDDHAGGPPLRVDYGFYVDAASVDADMPDLAMPTCVLHGRRDEVVPIEGSHAFVKANPTAKLVELDDDHPLTSSIDVMLPMVADFLLGTQK